MNFFLRVVIISFALCSLIGCKGNYNLDKVTIDSSGDYSVKERNTEINSLINYFQQQKEMDKIKVIYNKRKYTFERFNKKIGFENINNLQVIKDTLTISKYNIKNCKVLLLIE